MIFSAVIGGGVGVWGGAVFFELFVDICWFVVYFCGGRGGQAAVFDCGAMSGDCDGWGMRTHFYE